MADIQPLVDYLRIANRQSREAENQELSISVEVVDQFYNDFYSRTIIDIPKEQIDNASFYYSLESSNIDTIYIAVLNDLDQADSIAYYQRRETANSTIFEYKNIISDVWEVLDDANFIFVELGNFYETLYYNPTSNRIIINIDIPTLYLFSDFLFDRNHIPQITDGTYFLKYKDHTGRDYFLHDSIYYKQKSNFRSGKNSSVKVSLSSLINRVYLFPIIETNNFTEFKYKLRYIYTHGKKDIFGVERNNTAIVLEFNFLGTFLEFIKQTIFYDDSIDSLRGYNGMRQLFFDAYMKIIKEELNSVSHEGINKTLEILFYVPKTFLKEIPKYKLWRILGKAIEGKIMNYFGLDKEDIVLFLLEFLNEIIGDNTIFLSELLTRKINRNRTYFYTLFSKMNTTNFDKYNAFLKKIWLESDFKKPDNPIYNSTKNGTLVYNGPLLLPYKSKKTFGFIHSNTGIKWVDNYSKFIVVLGTGKHETIAIGTGKMSTIVPREIKFIYTYHPFQPIFIKDIATQNTELELDYRIPAFYLKAVEVRKELANIKTIIEYTGDILSTYSGIGNLIKLRHLTRVGKISKYTFRIKKGVAIIDIASGTINSLLKLTGLQNTKYVVALEEYLFYLEMAALSLEVTDWIHKGLKASSKKIIKNIDALKKDLDDLVKQGKLTKIEADEIINDFYKIEFNVNEFKKTYGKLVKQGNHKFLTDYKINFKRINTKYREITNAEKRKWALDFGLKKRKGSLVTYLKRRKTMQINDINGKTAEKIFKNINGGNKNFNTKNGVRKEKAIKTSLCNRFIDNLIRNIAREVKSGYLKYNDKTLRQIKKDIDIVACNINGIKKIEWHIIGGMDKRLLAEAYDFAKKNKVLDRIEFVFY